MESWNYHGVQGNHEALLGFVGIKGSKDQKIKWSPKGIASRTRKKGHEVGKLYFKTFKFL